MNVSVIIVVVFLNTLSVLSTRHLKRRSRNDQRLGIISSEIANTKLNPMAFHQSLKKDTKKLKASANGQQHQTNIPNLYVKMLNIIKTMPLSSQSRLKKVLHQLVTEEERCVLMSEKEPKNESYKNSCKGVLPTSKESQENNRVTKSHKNSRKVVRLKNKESGKEEIKGTKTLKNSSKGVLPTSKESQEDNRVTISHTSSSKVVRLNSKESGKEEIKGTKSRTKKRRRHNGTESKYKANNVTSEDIHPNNEESKNEKYGEFWPKCDKSDNKHCEENEPPNKETNNDSSLLHKLYKPANKGYKGANTDEITYKPNSATLQKEDINRRGKSTQNEMPLVDFDIDSEIQKIEYSQEANKEYQTNNTETQSENGERNTKGPPNKETGEGLLTHNKELENKDNETVKGPLKIEQNKKITEAIKDNNGSQQTMMSTKPSDVIQTTTNQPEITTVSDSLKHVNKFKMIQRILNDITPL